LSRVSIALHCRIRKTAVDPDIYNQGFCKLISEGYTSTDCIVQDWPSAGLRAESSAAGATLRYRMSAERGVDVAKAKRLLKRVGRGNPPLPDDAVDIIRVHGWGGWREAGQSVSSIVVYRPL